jgi:hypothetical protein
MDEMFLFVSNCMPTGNQMYVEKQILLETKEPGLLPSTVCTPALIACMAMNSALQRQYFKSV